MATQQDVEYNQMFPDTYVLLDGLSNDCSNGEPLL